MKNQINYLRILGNAEKEFIFLIDMALQNFKLNIDDLSDKDRRKWGRSTAKSILKTCRDYLDDKLPSNDN